LHQFSICNGLRSRWRVLDRTYGFRADQLMARCDDLAEGSVG
jgi:hypothetical protein